MSSSTPEEPSEQFVEHRRRLLEGMAGSVRRHGLKDSTVQEVVALARVSRRTFYQHFRDLVDCYLQLMDSIGDTMLAGARGAVSAGGPVEERIDRAIAGYLAMLEEDPELTRSYWTEHHLTGERGQGNIASATERTAVLMHALAGDLRRDAGLAGPIPFEVAVMITGGVREIVLHQIQEGRPPSEAREALSWLLRLVTLADPLPAGRVPADGTAHRVP